VRGCSLSLQVGLGGLADRVEKAMRPLWPALKAYAPCGTLAFIDAEQPGKVDGAQRVLDHLSRNHVAFIFSFVNSLFL